MHGLADWMINEVILYPVLVLWHTALTTLGFLLSPICAVGGIVAAFVSRDTNTRIEIAAAIGTLYSISWLVITGASFSYSSEYIGLLSGGPCAAILWCALAIKIRNFFSRKKTSIALKETEPERVSFAHLRERDSEKYARGWWLRRFPSGLCITSHYGGRFPIYEPRFDQFISELSSRGTAPTRKIRCRTT